MKKNDKDKSFQQFLKTREREKELDKKVQKYRHPINFIRYRSNQYSKYAIKNRTQIESVSNLSRRQGFQLMKQLISKWTPLHKVIVIIICIIIISSILIAI